MLNFLEKRYPDNKRVFNTITEQCGQQYDILELIKLKKEELTPLLDSWKIENLNIVEQQSFGHCSNSVANDNNRTIKMIEELVEFRESGFNFLSYEATEELVWAANLANFKVIMARELIIAKDFFENKEANQKAIEFCEKGGIKFE